MTDNEKKDLLILKAALLAERSTIKALFIFQTMTFIVGIMIGADYGNESWKPILTLIIITLVIPYLIFFRTTIKHRKEVERLCNE